MIGLRRKKEEPVQAPAPDKKIGEIRTRLEEIYWLMFSQRIRLLRLEAKVDQLRSEIMYRSLKDELQSLQEGGETIPHDENQTCG